ncbi:hypothetical protein OG552_10495 [Streptomyces sp. NBC_01476]|uniref:phage tail tube protein n=1 Tax=Streptomyces sp. NBC_01476 TaxID=2903881 RepID=UPI002E31327B|nr:hypothetical protein [Streptomyces sp. NBC_01476]
MGKFSRKGTTKILFTDTIAAAATTMLPTRVELTGATKLTPSIAAIDGFSVENQQIDTPTMEATFDAKIPGSDQASDSTITFYEDDTDNDIETTLAKGSEGFVIILRKGDVPASTSMDIYPVRVASISPQYTTDNEAAKFAVMFSITEPPVIGAAVPAAT